MKIGILTFHRACNYGGALQCFALAKKLNTMGYNVEVVDYRSKAIAIISVDKHERFKKFFSVHLVFT